MTGGEIADRDLRKQRPGGKGTGWTGERDLRLAGRPIDRGPEGTIRVPAEFPGLPVGGVGRWGLFAGEPAKRGARSATGGSGDGGHAPVLVGSF